jgi:16S rRNA (guanine527-N7)-methyltransferase
MQKYKQFTDLLLKYNKIHRLSGAKNAKEVEENIIDSLYPQKFIDFSTLKDVVDIGTGAGFPGMILAIEFPEVNFTLVEPLMKRTAFLHLVKSTYDLKNVTIVQERIEDIEPFKADLITSRAVAKSDFLLSLAKDFIDKDTKILLYKGSSVKEDLNFDFKYEIIPRGENRNYLVIN